MDLVAWLRAPRVAFPERYRARDQGDHAAVQRLEQALTPTGLAVPALGERPSRAAALVIVLFALGFKRRERLEAVIALARLPSAVAEALAERPTNFGNYPINLPRFTYTESP